MDLTNTVFLNAHFSADGTIRKNTKVREMWDPMQGNRQHR